MNSEAIQKIEKECEGAKNRRDYVEIANHVRDVIEANPGEAEKVLQATKAIGGAYEAMRAAARKNAAAGCYCMVEAEAWEIVDGYFGFAEVSEDPKNANSQTPAKATVVSLFDLV